jgi:signal peptidase I
LSEIPTPNPGEPKAPTPPPAAEPPRGILAWVWEIARTWGPAILAIIVIRTFVFQPFSIPSTSMVPTLLIGDQVIVTKYSYGLWFPNPTNFDRWEFVDWSDPKRGDIIVFRFPLDKNTHYIKRVVGVPGDRIEVRDNQLTINGQVMNRTETGRYAYQDADCGAPREANLWDEQLGAVSHPKLTDDAPSLLADYGPVTVPPNKVFVMGDNRDNSGDSRSREWTYVDEELIMGKAHFVWVSIDGCQPLFPLPFRWDRIGLDLYGEVKPNVP